MTRLRLSQLGMALLFLMGSHLEAVEVRFNGFADISYGTTFGDFATQADRDKFEAVGGDADPKNVLRGFVLAGLDSIVTVDVSDSLIFQTEVNLQSARGAASEIELDVERAYVDYLIRPEFNIQLGLYFTPIGYLNRNLYARAWLMNSVQVRDVVEEELGLIPTHSTGVNFHGGFDIFGDHTLMYALNISNGRAPDPTSAVYARDPDDFNEISLLLEYRNPNFKNFRFGLSGWMDTIDVPGYAPNGGTARDVRFREFGFDPYVVFENQHFGLLAELVYINSDVRKGNLSRSSYELTSISVEGHLSFMNNRLHPYVRYDETNLPGNGDSDSYWNVRGTASEFVPEFKAIMVGVNYDLTTLNRVKLEYIHHLDGARRKHGIAAQTAIAF